LICLGRAGGDIVAACCLPADPELMIAALSRNAPLTE
jgi:hypothetical protein